MPMTSTPALRALENAAEFLPRHIGIDAEDEALMLSAIGEASRRALIDSIVPRSIARHSAMELPPACTEADALAELKAIAGKNQVLRSFIGKGYYAGGCSCSSAPESGSLAGGLFLGALVLARARRRK